MSRPVSQNHSCLRPQAPRDLFFCGVRPQGFYGDKILGLTLPCMSNPYSLSVDDRLPQRGRKITSFHVQADLVLHLRSRLSDYLHLCGRRGDVARSGANHVPFHGQLPSHRVQDHSKADALQILHCEPQSVRSSVVELQVQPTVGGMGSYSDLLVRLKPLLHDVSLVTGSATCQRALCPTQLWKPDLRRLSCLRAESMPGRCWNRVAGAMTEPARWLQRIAVSGGRPLATRPSLFS